MGSKGRARELPGVAAFIRFIESRLSSGAASSHEGRWFSRPDEGSLFLDPEEARAYSRVVTEVVKQHVPRDDLSRRSVEAFLQEALFTALDPASRSSSPFEKRLQVALDRLAVQLNAPSEIFRCWVPVEGLQLDQPSARFGGLNFTKFGHHQLRKLTLQRPAAQGRGASWQQNLKRLRESDTWNSVCAVVDVSARDFASAEGSALRRTRQILDILNVFTDLLPYNYGWLYLWGETTKALQVIPIQRRNGDFTASYTNLEPLTDLSWKSLRSAKHIARALRNLDSLVRSDNRADTCAALLVSAAQWAGRATIDRRHEQSFLLYAIALETMMLPTIETGELSYRLRLRVAHLLGKTGAGRERIAKEVGRLYGIRSRIVHAGSYEVTDEDLWSMRSIVKGALLRLVQTPKIHASNRQQLAAWLDRRTLS